LKYCIAVCADIDSGELGRGSTTLLLLPPPPDEDEPPSPTSPLPDEDEPPSPPTSPSPPDEPLLPPEEDVAGGSGLSLLSSDEQEKMNIVASIRIAVSARVESLVFIVLSPVGGLNV
jgi:hypothetical protein